MKKISGFLPVFILDNGNVVCGPSVSAELACAVNAQPILSPAAVVPIEVSIPEDVTRVDGSDFIAAARAQATTAALGMFHFVAQPKAVRDAAARDELSAAEVSDLCAAHGKAVGVLSSIAAMGHDSTDAEVASEALRLARAWQADDEHDDVRRMARARLTNPHTGTLRDPRDVASDPAGVLIAEPGAPLRAAAERTESATRDAYEGARVDLLDWKGRAQRAEARLRAVGWTGLEANQPPEPSAPGVTFDLIAHLQRQRDWSERTFGPGSRTQGVVDHIRKELAEIESAPGDVSEWIDVAILAFDGAWRAGFTPQQIVDALVAKQTKNEGRIWPDWRTMPADKAIEHDRSADVAAPAGGVSMDALNYDPTGPDKMRLPAGATCGDCVHIYRCKSIFGHVESDTSCDWSPSRFRRANREPADA